VAPEQLESLNREEVSQLVTVLQQWMGNLVDDGLGGPKTNKRLDEYIDLAARADVPRSELLGFIHYAHQNPDVAKKDVTESFQQAVEKGYRRSLPR